jgi:hypothetical protein
VKPVIPEGIRPGQLGVVMLGRVIMGDIAATAADLALATSYSRGMVWLGGMSNM